jgi:NADPH:quinone reductase-like Zn-dependent oxidoreductase
MKAVLRKDYGEPETLELGEAARPELKDDSVLVRVQASSVNRLDWYFTTGRPWIARLQLGLRAPKSHLIGADFAGTVEAAGKDVTGLAVGDEVYGSRAGAFAEYVVARDGVARKPANLSFEDAAAVPVAGITALQGLRDKAKLQPGQKVLVNGASGGVGTFAVQLAKSFGAEVTGVCSTPNLELVRSLGADHVNDYTQHNFTRGKERYDLIIDNAGSRSLLAMRRVLGPTGTIVLVGASKGNWIGPIARILGASQLSRFGGRKMLGMLTDIQREDLAFLKDLIEAGKITPVIDRTYPLSETADAIRYLETMRARAKVIITVAA